MTRRTLSPLIGAALFLILYLLVSPLAGAVSTGALPLPGTPADEVHDYLAANTAGSLATGLLQGLSGVGLAIVVATLPYGPPRMLGRIAGWVAVAAILLSAALSIVLAIISPTAETEAVSAMRDASFILGGVTHVVAVGAFVLLTLASVRSWSKPVRIIAWIAGALAVLSVLSIAIYYASLLLPVGRLACMVALVVAGISIARRPVLVQTR